MKLTLNLASRTYVNRRTLYMFYAALTVVLLLLLAFNLVGFWRSRAEGEQLKSRTAALQQEMAGTDQTPKEPLSPKIEEEQQQRIAFANDLLLRDSFRWTRLLDQLEQVSITGVSIRGIQPEYKDGTVRLSGVAENVETLRRFVDRLINSPHFQQVYLLSQARQQDKGQQDGGKGGIAFSIVVQGEAAP